MAAGGRASAAMVLSQFPRYITASAVCRMGNVMFWTGKIFENHMEIVTVAVKSLGRTVLRRWRDNIKRI